MVKTPKCHFTPSDYSKFELANAKEKGRHLGRPAMGKDDSPRVFSSIFSR